MKYKEIEAKTRGIDLPVTAVNENGDNVIIDCVDDCYRVATLQKKWVVQNRHIPPGRDNRRIIRKVGMYKQVNIQI